MSLFGGFEEESGICSLDLDPDPDPDPVDGTVRRPGDWLAGWPLQRRIWGMKCAKRFQACQTRTCNDHERVKLSSPWLCLISLLTACSPSYNLLSRKPVTLAD